MRVLHVSSSYPLTRTDATAPFMAEMLEAQVRRGHTVGVLVPRVSGLQEGSRGGVRVIGVPYAPAFIQVWGYGRSLADDGRLRLTAAALTPVASGAMGWALRKHIRNERPDVVHLHWVLPLGALAALLPRDLPVVVSAHGADARYSTGRLRPLARSVLKRVDAVFAASTPILEALTEVEPSVADKGRVIPHGANSALFHPRSKDEARARLGVTNPTAPVILGVGRLVPKKGFDSLVAALPHVATSEAQLYIVGEGPERQRLESLVPENLRDRIHFIGARDREQVADWYAAADVVAIPGRPTAGDVDSGPVVLVEALAAGRPVVATRVGMIPDAIKTGKNGVLLDSADPEPLANAIDSAITSTNPWGLEARRTFEAIGDWDRVASQLDQVYGSVLSSVSRPRP